MERSRLQFSIRSSDWLQQRLLEQRQRLKPMRPLKSPQEEHTCKELQSMQDRMEQRLRKCRGQCGIQGNKVFELCICSTVFAFRYKGQEAFQTHI